MNPETKICQNCKQDFIIEPEPHTRAKLGAGLRLVWYKIYV